MDNYEILKHLQTYNSHLKFVLFLFTKKIILFSLKYFLFYNKIIILIIIFIIIRIIS